MQGAQQMKRTWLADLLLEVKEVGGALLGRLGSALALQTQVRKELAVQLSLNRSGAGFGPNVAMGHAQVLISHAGIQELFACTFPCSSQSQSQPV
mmetsp:Transcript_13117/g.23112  ORF Transcript_13117/g.23112 Transcript_13117/m.23112 type:complete len:95 (-) Transcript_13117:561-845(-)